MRVVIQRVSRASVSVEGTKKASIGRGLVVLVGFEEPDNQEDIKWLSGKIARLRIFYDESGLKNLSVQDIGGELMIVSQFTLHAATKKGNRPSYFRAAKAEIAIPLYKAFVKTMEQEMGKTVATGEFGAYMEIALVNDGPVTIIIDSKNRE